MPTEAAPSSDSIQVPSTPPAAIDMSAQDDVAGNEKSTYYSPPPMSSSMTPPPSTQPARYPSSESRPNSKQGDFSLASPPTTVRIHATKSLPTSEKIATAEADELRAMVQDLMSALTEARMSAAHFKLQHTLLSMETHEAAQRAEVEQIMTRREIEVLHAAEQRHRVAANTPRISVQPSPQPQIIALTKMCKDLEDERDEMEDRLQEIRKLLEMEKDRAELLGEENMLLKKRIRENREHFTKLKDSPIYATPRQMFTTPRRKSFSRIAEETPNHEPFAALLYADQMLSQETASGPATPMPTKAYTTKLKQGHVRGAHSLSSLHSTPLRRPLTSDGYSDSRVAASAPGLQLAHDMVDQDRHDRDSTITISDAEDGSGDDVPQSQASSLATNMLRKNPTSQESIRQTQEVERSSNLLQSKLFGNVKKSGVAKPKGKRSAGDDLDEYAKTKKTKLAKPVGLGVEIERWNKASS